MAKETQIIIKQSLLDVAIQQCGAATAAFELAVLNGLSVSNELAPGQLVNSDTVADASVADYYRNRNLKPATALTDADKDVINMPEGISYWGINVDFVVQ